MDVALPYVWQYNENYTHTVHIDSNRMSDNRDFGITIRGHFARVYIVNNTITDNFCHEGLLAMKGMEKEVTLNWYGNKYFQSIKNLDRIMYPGVLS